MADINPHMPGILAELEQSFSEVMAGRHGSGSHSGGGGGGAFRTTPQATSVNPSGEDDVYVYSPTRDRLATVSWCE
jgi:hypothetical protein